MNSRVLKPLSRIILILLLLSPLGLQTAAGWSNDPALNTPVCTESSGQAGPTIISDGSGGSIIAWTDDRGTTGPDIYAQRLGPDGTSIWAASGVPVCTAADHQADPQIVSDGAGGALIIWFDCRDDVYGDLYAQRLDAAGTPLWTANGVVVCDQPGGTINPALAADAQGGLIALWQDHRAGDDWDIYGQRLSPSGAALWTANGKAVCAADEDQLWPKIVSDREGGVLICWHDTRWLNRDIRAQRLNSSGTLLWDADGVMVCVEPSDQIWPCLASDGAGGAIICWRDKRNSPEYDIYAQRVDAGGSVQWTPDGVAVCTAVDIQQGQRLLSDGSGGAFIVWQDERGTYFDLYAQRVDSAGSMLWATDGLAVCTAFNPQILCRIVGDGSGGMFMAWLDYRSGSIPDIYAQRVDTDGGTLWPAEGVLVFGALNEQEALEIMGLGTKGLVAVCSDLRNGSNFDIYAQWVDADGQVGGFEPNTVSANFSCSPSSGTLPFSTMMSTMLSNSYTGLTRRISGQVNIRLAGGGTITNWRTGFTNLGPHQSYQTSWIQNIPAVGSMVGTNDFTLKAVDVTPAPYNHPPYPSAGDVDFATCSLTASAP